MLIEKYIPLAANKNIAALKKSPEPKNILDRFSYDQSGGIAAFFALMAPIIVAMAGAAVDTGRWISTRNATLHAMDAAVLAAGRASQLNGTTQTEALSVAQQYFDQNKPKRIGADAVQFSFEDNGTTIVAVSDTAISTPFLSVIGVEELPIAAVSKAIMAADGNAGTNIEISIMMDVTGSMCSPCTKIADLKLAAKDLIDIVIWDDQSTYQSRVALVPFSELVNVSQSYFRRATKRDPSGSGNQRTCVGERANTQYLYSDAWPNNERRFLGFGSSGTCRPQSTIVPLSSDRVALKSAIDNLSTGGFTAGHLGIGWTWYTLSPRFNRMWPSRLNADAAPYSDLDATNLITVGSSSYEVPRLRKIAVLMTDGVFNRQYNGPDSNTQARELCAEMKERGIEVYTVGFDIGNAGTAFDVLNDCASSEDHFYNAGDGDELRQAFRDIGLQIATLRLTQ